MSSVRNVDEMIVLPRGAYGTPITFPVLSAIRSNPNTVVNVVIRIGQ